MKENAGRTEVCPVCKDAGAPIYDLPSGKVCGDCIDRAVDARKEAEALANV